MQDANLTQHPEARQCGLIYICSSRGKIDPVSSQRQTSGSEPQSSRFVLTSLLKCVMELRLRAASIRFPPCVRDSPRGEYRRDSSFHNSFEFRRPATLLPGDRHAQVKSVEVPCEATLVSGRVSYEERRANGAHPFKCGVGHIVAFPLKVSFEAVN